jgi:hypothetical protein
MVREIPNRATNLENFEDQGPSSGNALEQLGRQLAYGPRALGAERRQNQNAGSNGQSADAQPDSTPDKPIKKDGRGDDSAAFDPLQPDKGKIHEIRGRVRDFIAMENNNFHPDSTDLAKVNDALSRAIEHGSPLAHSLQNVRYRLMSRLAMQTGEDKKA